LTRTALGQGSGSRGQGLEGSIQHSAFSIQPPAFTIQRYVLHVWRQTLDFVILSGGGASPPESKDLRLSGTANNVLQRDWLAPLFRQVLPRRVLRFDQMNLLLSPPALELFLARDRIANIAEDLVPDQTVNVVPCSKALEGVFPVLPHPPLEIVSDTHVELVRPAGENVGRVAMLSHIAIVSLRRSAHLCARSQRAVTADPSTPAAQPRRHLRSG